MMQQDSNEKRRTPRFISRRDATIIGALVLAVAIGLFAWLALRRPGAQALVTVGTGQDAASEMIDLAPDRVLHIDAALPVTLEISGGRIRFSGSVCPDHNCEGFGWLQNEGDWALCAPAGVMVRVARAGG